ncbi:FYVE, RhoGEF and PH domain-containing protein 2-like [Periplaneta americana]|uniref:FYVE, RhoGEF and PH domain-containing protein 2-like n=1 Tax=Periplaneta americana TaxID=6978 RepID=UPI0037E82A83
MEREQHFAQEVQDWFPQSENISQGLGLGLNTEARKFFQEAREKFTSSSGTGSDLFSKFVKENEERFLLHCSSRASVGGFEQDGRDFIRSFSAGSGWTMSPLQAEQKLQSQTSPPVKFPAADKTWFSGGFPMFVVSNRRMFTESWSEKFSMSRSSIEYCTNLYRYTSEQVTHCESYDVSESESEDDDVSQAICSDAASETSSLSTLEKQGHILAIEADPRREKAFRIAMELLTTERSYVAVLHLIDQIFHFRVDQENRAHNMFPQEMIPQMFSNIKSIYQFHHDFLLPQLEVRMTNWDQEGKIGDIMKNFAPFLKLYTEYVKNFDNAMNIISALAAKNQRFGTIMDEIHRMPECGNLTLSHHMLSPIQRIPRYELLLKDYLKKLPEDSVDKEDTEKALHLVSTAANHANEAMKKIDKFKQLLEVQEKISGVVDLVSPTRELLKEGKIVKISARSGDHQERYLFLFSDLLLLCSPRLLPAGISAAFRLRAKFLVEAMHVLEGDNLETANTFYIRDNHKNVELYTQTVEEKTGWLDALCLAVDELYKRKSSFKVGTECSSPVDMQKAPNYIKMDGIQKCMDCSANFGVMKRKHHCRACGLVVCGKCSNQKYPLPFEDNKPSRVCRSCHQKLVQQRSASPEKNDSDAENITTSFTRGKGLLDVAADAECVFSGYLQLKTDKSWVRRWFALHPDFVLYSFRSHKDQRAMTATPLPGYTIAKVLELKGESFNDKEKVFKMYHAKKMYYFQGESKEIVEKWVSVLQMAAQAELPSPEKTDER